MSLFRQNCTKPFLTPSNILEVILARGAVFSSQKRRSLRNKLCPGLQGCTAPGILNINSHTKYVQPRINQERGGKFFEEVALKKPLPQELGVLRSSMRTLMAKRLFNLIVPKTNTFHLDKYNVVKVPLMCRASKFTFTVVKNFHCHIFKLPPFLGEEMGDHLTFEDHLTTDLMDTWLRNMKNRKTEVFFLKFKLDQKYEVYLQGTEEYVKQHGRAISTIQVSGK